MVSKSQKGRRLMVAVAGGVTLVAVITAVLFNGFSRKVGDANDVYGLPQTVRCQVDEYYPPLTQVQNGILTGFDTMLTNLIFETDRYDLQYSTGDWDSVYHNIVSGATDLAGIIAITEERKHEVLFTQPLFRSYISAYTRGDFHQIDIAELPSLRIGVGAGYYTEMVLRENLHIFDYVPYTDMTRALVDLTNGKIDVIFENQQYFDNVLIHRNRKGVVIAQLTNLFPRDHAYAVSKQHPELVEYMDRRIRELKASGVFEELYMRYFYTHSYGYEAKRNQRTLLIALSAAALLVAVYLAMYAMMRRLRRNLRLSYAQIDIANQKLTEANAKLEKKLEEIHRTAFTNQTTGLPNLQAFLQTTEEYYQTCDHPNLYMLFMDLDNFRDINDTFGHDMGDQALHAVAERLREHLRDGDQLFNFSGDGFTILMEAEADAQAECVAQTMLEAVNQPIVIKDNEFHLTASTGIANTHCDISVVELVKRAEAAMYRAKQNNHIKYQFYNKEIGDEVRDRIRLRNTLRRALEQGEFVLHYQPQVRAVGGELIGFEALLRWNHPERGLVLPGEFIRQAEENRMIVPIGLWVLRSACRFIHDLNARFDTRYRITVNVSIVQLMQPDFVTLVIDALRENELEPCLLELEITESSLLNDTEQMIEKIKTLSAEGIHVALDDFGTGYSSLRYLMDLPVHVLKIDRYFISRIEDQKSQTLIHTIVSVGHSLGMKLVAEGVETAQELALAVELQCDLIQGYFTGRPIPVKDIHDLVRNSSGVGAAESPASSIHDQQ